MARKLRFAPGGIVYHVMNRTWEGLELFGDEKDYEAFEKVVAEALEKREKTMRLCGYCLMPNHFHLVLFPEEDGQLSRFMQWVAMTHVQRWHAHRGSGGRGHVYQGRFRSFPVQRDEHFLSVCRYVERNALRAKLVDKAADWRWGSLHVRQEKAGPLTGLLADWPVDRPRNWSRLVETPQTQAELAALREAVSRGRPYGSDAWTASTAKKLGIVSAIRPIGRPRKTKATEAKGR